ncbi:MAPEG family protein [Amaricoccus sp.]|uniref:MAPEG family protein n=1 Tax=Amaricoccus sp. TaxID=1872485 RepID=UPI001B46152B|nr:MAPEG family protein [Amaricoccus sp.]MBP7243460.1 MAPEG family protein [Amaricoccus sp.]
MTSSSTLHIVALYVGLNGLILFWLALAISRIRTRTGVWIGDGGVEELIRAMRGQANFTEFVPFGLLMLLLMAALGLPWYLVHVFGATLTVGRIAHAAHFTGAYDALIARQVGAMLTFLPITLGSVGLIFHALTAMG